MKVLFSTKRCDVGQLNLRHVSPFVAMHTNPEVMTPIPMPVLEATEAKALLEDHILAYHNPNATTTILAITRKGSDSLIGVCALLQKGDKVEIGIRVHPDYWRQKYASEIVPALITHAFEQTNTRMVVAQVSSSNYKSIKLFERFLDYKGKKANREMDTMDHQYGMLRQEWVLKG